MKCAWELDTPLYELLTLCRVNTFHIDISKQQVLAQKMGCVMSFGNPEKITLLYRQLYELYL